MLVVESVLPVVDFLRSLFVRLLVPPLQCLGFQVDAAPEVRARSSELFLLFGFCEVSDFVVLLVCLLKEFLLFPDFFLLSHFHQIFGRHALTSDTVP